MVAHPQNPGSTDRWLRLERPAPTQAGGEHVGALTEILTKTKASLTLVGYIPKASAVIMTIFFERKAPAPPIPLLHIDLLPNGDARLNESTVAAASSSTL